MSNSITCKTDTNIGSFLNSIFPEFFEHDGHAFIEVRILGDQEKNVCHGQRWYPSVQELLEDFDPLNDLAMEKKACIAFSPALRKRKKGKKDSVLGSWCIWNDQNQNDGGQEACIQRLREDDVAMTVVDSGYAAHGYVLLTEFCTDIKKIEQTNRLLKERLGGDNVWDASRVMRLPGTLNLKKPEKPQACRLLELTDQRYDIDELIELLDGDGGAESEGQTDFLCSEAKLALRYDPCLQRLEPGTVAMVFECLPVGERSENDLAVANRLVAADLTDEDIKGIFARYACGEKAREGCFDKYMDRTLSKARSNGHLYLPAKRSIPATADGLRKRI